MKNIYILDWTEFESGWGCRPDGMQIFTEYSELEKTLKRNEKERKESKVTPLEYSIPTTKFIAEVNEEDFSNIVKLIDKYSVWLTTVGKRDMSYIKNTYKSLKIIATENL